MNKKLLFLPIFVLSLFLITSIAQADVVLEDIEAAIEFSSAGPFTSSTIETGTGNTGDYVVTTCGVVNPNEANVFSAPTPGIWTELDTGQCGGDFSCLGGTWGRFVFEPNSTETTCSWSGNNDVFAFAAVSMRFSQVDADPIIDVQCDTGSGPDNAVAPSINTEAGSYVLRVYTFSPFEVPTGFSPQTSVNFDIQFGEGFSFNTFQVVASHIQGMTFADAGPTGTFDLVYNPPNPSSGISWRACTIGLRMGTPPLSPTSSVPTMSEWGLISFAAFAGIAGVWYLRRRQAIA